MDIQELMARQEPLDPELAALIEEGGVLGKQIRHPLVYAIPYSEVMNAYYNEQLKYKKAAIAKALAEKDYSLFLVLHEKPYRMQALGMIEGKLTDVEFWELFGDMWVGVENIWQYKALLGQMLRTRQVNHDLVHNEEERAFFAVLPEELVVYRGHQGINVRGWSHTLSFRLAYWFAEWLSGGKDSRRKSRGVTRHKVFKKDVLAVFLRRGEVEVVVDPKKLGKVVSVKKLPRPAWLKRVIEIGKAEFKLGSRSDHGFRHWEKVDENLGAMGITEPWCRCFAYLHDCQRQDEYEDKDHGKRAAAFIEANAEMFSFLRKSSLESLIYACAHHNSGETHADPLIGGCWDADRLDLFRVGIVPLASFFSTERGKGLIGKV